jgi:hypothetical protein
MRLWIGLSVSAVLLAFAACDGAPTAPTDVGICWRMTVGADGKPAFAPVSNTARTLETCGAHLEAVALRENKAELTGAFQGQFIFITPAMVQSSMRLKGVRYRLFDADTRAKIDRELKWMLEDEKHPSQFGPQGPGVGAPK